MGKICAIIGPSGDGKALLNSERVLTPKGWIPIGELKKNDIVLNSKGSKSTIVNVFPQGKKDIYVVEFDDGTIIQCCKDHLWSVYSYNSKNMQVKSTEDLWKDDKLCVTRKDNRNSDWIAHTIKYRIPLIKGVIFDDVFNKEDDIDPYLLGVILGDGSLNGGSTSLTLNNKYADKIIQNLNLPEGIELSIRDKRENCISYTLAYRNNGGKSGKGNPITKFFKLEGLENTKSIDKFIPKHYLYKSVQDRQSLMKGLLDTDGYTKNGSYYEYSTSSKQLAYDVTELAQSLGYFVKIVGRVPVFKYKGEIKEGEHNYRVLINMGKQVKKIISITKTTMSEEMTCIEVDSSDHLYITEGYTLTHNTTSTIINPDGNCNLNPDEYNGMNPETHLIINLDMKELPFPAGMWGHEFNNYLETDDMDTIRGAIIQAAKMEHVKSIALDTINLFLAYKEYNDRKKMSFDQWRELANDLIEINKMCNQILRPDQIAYIFGHVENITDIDGQEKMVMAVSGKKSRKQMPEGFYPIVLISSKEAKANGDIDYFFRTKSPNTSAKAPIGMFNNSKIPNSLKLVDDAIRAYYKM